jgi:outer membrane protein assembly factor BamB
MRRALLFGCGVLLLLGAVACATMEMGGAPPAPLEYKGSKDLVSEPFDVNTKEWQISWEYKAEEKKVPNFVLNVYPEGDKANFVEMVKTPRFDASGTTYLYKGKGRYYAKITARNIASWKVKVIREGVAEALKSPATFGGSADTTTKPFKIEGKKFRVTYTMVPVTALMYEGGGQSIAVYPRGETEQYLNMTLTGAGTGAMSFDGPGEYYIKVQCSQVKDWKIDVKEE